MQRGIVVARAPQVVPAGGRARPQMADVARLAGVSVASVSRALRGEPGVRENLRHRIEDIARQLHYEVDEGARNLRIRHNRTISVVVPHSPAAGESLSDPFLLALIGSIADALTARSYDLLLSRIDTMQVGRLCRDVESRRAMGVIVVGQGHHHEQLNMVADRGVPLVVWGAHIEGRRYATVGSDNRLGGRLATAHLLDGGARRVAFIGDTSLPEVAHRHAGYVDAHHARGLLPPMELTRPAPFVQARVERELASLLAMEPGIDAIFASSDLTAMTVVHALHRAGLRVPEDLQVVGFDDIPMVAQMRPALSSVAQSVEQAGAALLRALEAVVDGAQAPSIVLPTTLQPRESTRLAPCESARQT